MAFYTKALFKVMRSFRRSRAETIAAEFGDLSDMNVLDLGGSTHFWDAVDGILAPQDLTILNVVLDGTSISKQRIDGRYTVELYDGRRIPYDDRHFDIVICNSVIEHVPPPQRSGLAEEIKRVGKHYAVQTPAQEFFFEPHFIAPFVHWFPRRIGRKLVKFSPRGFGGGRPVTEVWDETILLTRGEMTGYFGNGKLHVERVIGMPKSYLVTR